MKILVTGAAGFIGYFLCEALLKQNLEVVGLDNINDYYSTDLKYDRLKELGIDADKLAISKGLIIGDEYFYQENSKSIVSNRPKQEQMEVWLAYESAVFKELGIEEKPEWISSVLNYVKNINYQMVLFDDVLPTFKQLSNNRYKLGIISNIDRDIKPMCEQMGIMPFLDLIVTSLETGLCKPMPEIFSLAAKESGFEPTECIFAGDQYEVDVIASQKAGMTGVLVDRQNLQSSQIDEYSVSSLVEIPGLITIINRE